jgi:creatinine amidohydrolase/Fe(II)-dependent formamide hydrolase-like protein
MMHVRPELVRMAEIEDDELKPMLPGLAKVYLPLDMKRQTKRGGTGQPTLATAAKGKALLEAVLVKAIESVKAMRLQAL